MKVKTTKDYSQFKTIEGNRSVNESHVSKLMQSMKNELLVSPIIVNENDQVIDGQHRLEACKRLRLPVHYIVVNGYRRDQVQTLNKNSRNWNTSDFVDSMISSGKKDYKELKDFKDKYKLPYTACILLLSNSKNSMGSDSGNKFRNGGFVVKDKKKAHSVANMINELSTVYPFVRSVCFVKAFNRCIGKEGFNEGLFVHRVLSGTTTLRKQSTSSHYLSVIEEAYNYRLHNKINLRF